MWLPISLSLSMDHLASLTPRRWSDYRHNAVAIIYTKQALPKLLRTLRMTVVTG